ncbi:LysR substrate-binding domain-containing protein [Stenotrophomonas sp. 24(2023)]|uniref:LysR family transcriptional regulator n=1 Tax=Stenotrophomonas sp. 24(2023) TaxID=3068324 RepID=UPI0027E0A6D8|nr:LysR substrate-binding domain-containing protein [Stenotrophomonas sp. 24(2023)]WMJ68958.1 LysR substrate-binding domain-containing protein [Stenotrophomonas sp. 24(2023)]
MDLKHLRAFVTVAEQLHFAHSAEQLGVSPPTLTAQIQALERLLQARLFQRTRRSVALTAAGEAFLVEARAALAQVERALETGRRAGRGQLGRVDIGYVGSAVFSGALQAQVLHFRRRWPQVQLGTCELPTAQLVQQLEEGQLDVAFVRTPVVLPSSVASHVVARDRFCLALAADHPLAGSGQALASRVLAGEAFVAPEQGLGLREVARRGRFDPHIVSVPGSLQAVLAQVALGAGIAVVPSVLVQVVHLPNVVYRDIAGAVIPSEVAALFRRHERAPAVRQLIQQIRQVKCPA